MRKDWEQLLLNPPPNSKLAAAKEFGIDLTLLRRNLKLTPEQRIEENVQICMDLELLAAQMKKSRLTRKRVSS